MYQIDNQKFGQFITALRKEKNMTQKQLAEKLFVSDKTVSKWERGLSMPNIILLIPIADIFEVTVTELLKGEKLDSEKEMKPCDVENLVVGSLDLSVRNSIRQQKKYWIIAYIFCVLVTAAEIWLLISLGLTLSQMYDNILLLCGLSLLMSGWFCFFAKTLLPSYYDENKIHYVSQGIFRINLAGLAFNNSNWPYICRAAKISLMTICVLYPLLCYLCLCADNIDLWNSIRNRVAFVMIIAVFASIYITGKKHQ